MQMSNNKYDVIIIGGGASGLMCASYLHFKAPFTKVLILERNNKLGAKVLVTGNGRCNLTNTSIVWSDYNTDSYDKLTEILRVASVKDTMDFFENNLGLHLAPKDDLIYPFSNKSSSVVDSFKFYLDNDATTIKLQEKVTAVASKDDGYEVTTSAGAYATTNVVFAGGGCAAPKTGSDGSIYKLLLNFARKSDFTQVVPSLVQLKTSETDTYSVAGTRVQADLSLYSGTEYICSSSGEMMFTDYGISGICVFCLSGEYNRAVLAGKKNMKVKAKLMPEHSLDEIKSLIDSRVKAFPERSMTEILMGFFTRELSEIIVARSGNDVDAICKTIYEFTFTIKGSQGFDNAQVTSGGLNLDALTSSCELISKPGVYAIGELVNVDGPCGGYNLQWAWSSGMVAASDIAAKVGESYGFN